MSASDWFKFVAAFLFSAVLVVGVAGVAAWIFTRIRRGRK